MMLNYTRSGSITLILVGIQHTTARYQRELGQTEIIWNYKFWPLTHENAKMNPAHRLVSISSWHNQPCFVVLGGWEPPISIFPAFEGKLWRKTAKPTSDCGSAKPIGFLNFSPTQPFFYVNLPWFQIMFTNSHLSACACFSVLGPVPSYRKASSKGGQTGPVGSLSKGWRVEREKGTMVVIIIFHKYP